MGKIFRLSMLFMIIFSVGIVSLCDARRPPDAQLKVQPEPNAVNFLDFYESLEKTGQAPLITTDAALWAVGELSAQLRSELDLQAQAPALKSLLMNLETALLDASDGTISAPMFKDPKKPDVPANLQDSIKLALDYIRIAQALLEPKNDDPLGLEKEINRVRIADGTASSTICTQNTDYGRFALTTQHNRTTALQNYGHARAWLANFRFRYDDRVPGRRMLKSDPPRLRGGWFTGIDTLEAGNGDIRQMRVLEAMYPDEGLTEIRAAAIIALLMDQTQDNNISLLKKWKRINKLETAWAGQAETPGPIELVEALKIKLEENNKEYSLESALKYLANDYDTLVYIAWLESRVRQPRDVNHDGARYFTFLGPRPPIEKEILAKMARSKEWDAGYTGNKSPFSLVIDGTKKYRGYPRGFDLAAAMQNNIEARKFLEREGDRDYYLFADRSEIAREVWLKSSRSGEQEDSWFTFIDDDDPLPVRTQLLQACQKSVEPSRAVHPDVYVWQDAHRLVRLNTMLGYATWLNYEVTPAEVQSVNGRLKSLQNTTGDTAKKGPGYLDPFPHVYLQLSEACKRMAELAQEYLGKQTDTTRRCASMKTLMHEAAEVAERQIEKPDKSNKEDEMWIRNWAKNLRNVLTPETLSKTYIARSADTPISITSVPWRSGNRALQFGLGPVWRVDTVVAVGEHDRHVSGALFSHYEFKIDEDQKLVDNTTWQQRLQSGKTGQPMLLEPLIPPPSITSKIDHIVAKPTKRD